MLNEKKVVAYKARNGQLFETVEAWRRHEIVVTLRDKAGVPQIPETPRALFTQAAINRLADNYDAVVAEIEAATKL